MRKVHKDYLPGDAMMDARQVLMPQFWPHRTNTDETILLDVTERMGLQFNGELLGGGLNKMAFHHWRNNLNL